MHCHCGTNNRARRWIFTDPCKPEVRPVAREESASPAWLAAPAMNARDTTKGMYGGLTLDVDRHYIGSVTATTHQGKCIKKKEEIFPRFGCPLEIVSDNRTKNVNRKVQETLDAMNIHHIKTSYYYPQANGHVGRFNKTHLCDDEENPRCSNMGSLPQPDSWGGQVPCQWVIQVVPVLLALQ